MSLRNQLKTVIEAALMAAGEPLSVDRLLGLFEVHEATTPEQIRHALANLQQEYQERGADCSIELIEVATGYRFQVKSEFSQWIARLWQERPTRYSRALLETLALIAYRQPITRAEIEDVRGVAVSSAIMKTLLEREWVRAVGHRDVPGKPALYATTRQFLDHFNLKSLAELPPLSELQDLEAVQIALPALAAEVET